MDMYLPGTPVSIDIEDAMQDTNGHYPRPKSNTSSKGRSTRSQSLQSMLNGTDNFNEIPRNPPSAKNGKSSPSVSVSNDSFVDMPPFQFANSNNSLPTSEVPELTSQLSSGKSPSALLDEGSEMAIPFPNQSQFGSQLTLEGDVMPSRSPPPSASYKVATRSIPQRPKSGSRPQSSTSVSTQKTNAKSTTQSTTNRKNQGSCISFISDDGQRRNSASSSTSSRDNASSSTESRSRSTSSKSGARSRIASALISKFSSTSKSPSPAQEEQNNSLYPESTSNPRLQSALSKKSRSGSNASSTVSLSDVESPRNEDLSWRTKLRPNCFLPQLSEKYLCPACKYILYYPVQLSNCDHHVCSSCLSNIMRGVAKCPVDRKAIDRSQVLIKEEFRKELNSKQLVCPQNDLGCQWTGTYENFKEHHATCEHADSICPNGCGLRCERRHMNVHVMQECSYRTVTCEFCNRAIRAEKEIDHLKQCPRFPQIPREELVQHIEQHCPFGEIKCPFNRIGCFVTGTRDFIRRHISDDLPNHMEMLCQGINQNIDKIEQHKETIDQQKLQLKENDFQVSNLIKRQGCQFLWKIDNWSQRVVDATSGRETILKSPPFYSGKYGYKLGLKLMPNGDGKAKGSNLSIYACVCKGEYDALQTWPFSMTITFTLVDQCQDPRAKVDYCYVLRPNPCKENLPFLGRPTTNANPSFGIQCFAPLDMLETRDYVREDVIFIKIITETET